MGILFAAARSLVLHVRVDLRGESRVAVAKNLLRFSE